MPIKEESFRIGCGRYIQGKGYVSKLKGEVERLGSRPLMIGGKTALSLTRNKIEATLNTESNNYKIITHVGTCNDDTAKSFAELAIRNGYDVIVGVGGGVIMDLAKLCAHYASLPIINLPTSSATCAAYTPLSVRYTAEGRTVGALHYENEVNCVIVDTETISAQPMRLLLSGVFDALAKFVEIKHRFTEGVTEYPMGLDYAYVLSEYSHKFLTQKTQKCIDDIRKNEISADVENIIFTTIAATAVISGIARGSNQTALAHKFYENTRFLFPEGSKPYLHGELVGMGLILQNHYNGEETNNTELIRLMRSYNMPYRLKDIGVPSNQETFNLYYEKLSNSSAIENEDDKKKLIKSMKYLWELN